jgi:DNA-directed RNA polymerase subunit E'/Rpb7
MSPLVLLTALFGGQKLIARVAELVDALVLGTSAFGVRVRVSPFAPLRNTSLLELTFILNNKTIYQESQHGSIC